MALNMVRNKYLHLLDPEIPIDLHFIRFVL